MEKGVSNCDKNYINVSIDGFAFLVETGTTSGDRYHWDLVNERKWENNTYHIFREFLSKDYSYIDIGAHIGMTVLYGSRLAKSVYAFEPEPCSIKALENNLRINCITNVRLLEMALNSYDGVTSLNFEAAGNSGASIIIPYSSNIIVRCARLNSVINDFKDINFAKIDIEGAEILLLPDIITILHSADISILLSLHAPFFSDQNKYFDTLWECIKIYSFRMDESGKAIDRSCFFDLRQFCSIILHN